MCGKELDTLIEHELQLMLVEGFDKSPISAKALHIRLKAKGILNGGLSTLSSLERKRLIAAYVDQQLTYHVYLQLTGPNTWEWSYAGAREAKIGYKERIARGFGLSGTN